MRQGVPPRREGTLQRHRLVAQRGLAGKTSRSMSKRAFAGRDPLLDQRKEEVCYQFRVIAPLEELQAAHANGLGEAL
jgi:hypothetical protein